MILLASVFTLYSFWVFRINTKDQHKFELLIQATTMCYISRFGMPFPSKQMGFLKHCRLIANRTGFISVLLYNPLANCLICFNLIPWIPVILLLPKRATFLVLNNQMSKCFNAMTNFSKKIRNHTIFPTSFWTWAVNLTIDIIKMNSISRFI